MIIKSPHFVWEKYRCSIASGGLEPFGELFTELGNEALWPMVVCMACYDCVSISLASVWDDLKKRAEGCEVDVVYMDL